MISKKQAGELFF